MDDPILTMRAVGKRFPGVVALRDVSLDVARGEGHVLLGENGAGKSTLINLLAGVYPADEGEIAFDGQPYRPRTPTDAFRAGIRVVHQELSMLMQMTVAENLMFERLPQRRGIVDYRETNRRAAQLLEEVGLDVAPTTQVSRLGVAQMQLIEIAKTLVYESKLLILDEPTATLTSKEVDRLFDILQAPEGARRHHSLHLAPPAGDRRDRRPRDRAARRPARGDAAARRPDDPRHRRHDGGPEPHRTSTPSAPTSRSLARRCASKASSATRAAPRFRSLSPRARSSASRGWWAAAAPRRRARSSAPTRRSPARSSSRASA